MNPINRLAVLFGLAMMVGDEVRYYPTHPRKSTLSAAQQHKRKRAVKQQKLSRRANRDRKSVV